MNTINLPRTFYELKPPHPDTVGAKDRQLLESIVFDCPAHRTFDIRSTVRYESVGDDASKRHHWSKLIVICVFPGVLDTTIAIGIECLANKVRAKWVVDRLIRLRRLLLIQTTSRTQRDPKKLSIVSGQEQRVPWNELKMTDFRTSSSCWSFRGVAGRFRPEYHQKTSAKAAFGAPQCWGAKCDTTDHRGPWAEAGQCGDSQE